MRHWWGIRHVRYWYLSWQYRRWYASVRGTFGVDGVPNEWDRAYLERVRRGQE